MKTAEKLRIETDKLEKKVKSSIEEFIEEVGDCDIKIDTCMSFRDSMEGKRKLVSTVVKIYVTV